jgi:hypothetical protein
MSQARSTSREAQHDGKTQYRNKQAAKAACRDVMRRGGGLIVPYRCPWCEQWHVGHDRSEWGAVAR